MKIFVWSWWKAQSEYKAWKRLNKEEAELTRLGLNWIREDGADVEDEPDFTYTVEDRRFTLAWLQAVICEAVSRMEAYCAQTGQTHHSQLFKARVLLPVLEGAPAPGYAAIYQQYGFASPAEAQNALTTGKRIFKRMIRSAMEYYQDEAGEPRSEMRPLKQLIDELEQDDSSNQIRARGAFAHHQPLRK